MQCKTCNSSNTVMKSGVSKKTGKPWKGVRCNDCNEMTFMKTEFTGTSGSQTGNQQVVQLLAKILNALNEIKAKLPKGQEEPMDAVPNETFEDEGPF